MNLNVKKKEEAPLKKKLFRCGICGNVKKKKFMSEVTRNGKPTCKVCNKPSMGSLSGRTSVSS